MSDELKQAINELRLAVGDVPDIQASLNGIEDTLKRINDRKRKQQDIIDQWVDAFEEDGCVVLINHPPEHGPSPTVEYYRSQDLSVRNEDRPCH